MLFLMFLIFLPALAAAQPCIVLTLDVSESMEEQDRLDTLGVTLYNWFDQVPDDVLLGMVAFSTEGELLSQLTTSRKELKDDIPMVGQGETCIGCGIQLALQVLRESNKSGVIVLITDGQNTVQGQDIAPLEDLKRLASKTGGHFFFVPDGTGDIGLSKALKSALQLAEWQLTTTESSVDETKPDSLLPTSSAGIASTPSSRYKNKTKDRTSFREPAPKYHHASSYWLIIGLIAALVGALLLVGVIVLVLWRQLFVHRVNGFYQVAYAERNK
ncbi:hypothetical protein C0J52_02638 [Blattella germanica]|nr:hypothetical protein C0J52_02638 [Blattella germanica]